jgi:hypothetical protein
MTDVGVGEALEAAAGKGRVPIIRYLLQECGANVSLYGPDALRAALEHGNPEAVCLLLEAGTPTDGPTFVQAAQCYYKRNKYCRPEAVDAVLQAAIQHGHTQFAEMLSGLRAAQPVLEQLCWGKAFRLLQRVAP